MSSQKFTKPTLASEYPELAAQWHPYKNGDYKPSDFTKGSKKTVWWKCEKGHEWDATVGDRARKGYGCPFCSGKRACTDNSLQTLRPDIAKQWHPTRNGDKTPNDVTVSSSKIVWWMCELGHEWEARIAERKRGRGCPQCKKETRTSFPEQAIYFYIKSVFSDAVNGYKHDKKWEIDIFIPSINFGIEYDGIYYHKDKANFESEKDNYLRSKGITILRVKEKEGNTTECYREGDVIYCGYHLKGSQFDAVVKSCLDYISENITKKAHSISIDIEKDRFDIYDLYIKGIKENSLHAIYPDISAQWHPERNKNLKPDMIKPHSKKRVWWKCNKGHEHEWEATIGSRVIGRGCPFCSGKRVCDDNCLKNVNPDLAAEWHPTKNGDLTPANVTVGSPKNVWWKCEKGDEHEWKASINDRSSGVGCPFCSGNRACSDNSLQTLRPNIAKQWHPTKNGNKTPNDVTIGSNKSAWWLCEKDHTHIWEAVINDRVAKKLGCPFCSGKRASSNNCLQVTNPSIAKEWHTEKNELTPYDVTDGSGKKVWWKCKEGHVWQARIVDRKKGRGCPDCHKNRNTKKTIK